MQSDAGSRRIIIISGGGHAKSVIDAAVRSGKYSEIMITDNVTPAGGIVCGCKVIGTDNMLSQMYHEGIEFAFIGLGSIKSTVRRRQIYSRVSEIGFSWDTVIDPSAVISDRVTLGTGVFVGKNAVVNAETEVSSFAIINTGAIVEHECRIGEFTHIAVGATVCGGCRIDNDVFVGANATVIQGVKIGMNSVIGAGSIVLNDVPKNTTVIGIWGGLVK